MRATLSRAVPSSPVILASMTIDGLNSSGMKKSGAWSYPGTRSARFVLRKVIRARVRCSLDGCLHHIAYMLRHRVPVCGERSTKVPLVQQHCVGDVLGGNVAERLQSMRAIHLVQTMNSVASPRRVHPRVMYSMATEIRASIRSNALEWRGRTSPRT